MLALTGLRELLDNQQNSLQTDFIHEVTTILHGDNDLLYLLSIRFRQKLIKHHFSTAEPKPVMICKTLIILLYFF
jgi:hypothetical protein